MFFFFVFFFFQLSAENFKLKEELSKAHRKMIAEVEESVDKGVTIAGAAHAQKKVIQKETSKAIQSMMTLPSQALAAQGIKVSLRNLDNIYNQ